MPRKAVMSALSEVGVPVTFDAWPVGKAPPLPWITFSYRRGGEVYADDTNYAELTRFSASLFYREYDEELHERFVAAISSLGTYRRQGDGYVDSENCYMAEYDFTYLPNHT